MQTLLKLFGGQRVVRNVYAETLLENFFVAGVASVLAVRLSLYLTGYPSLSPGELHMAHVLLGGLLMVVALIIAIGFLNRGAMELAAVIGGVGFGIFIDELGKFITSDNNYFYEPTVALIYIAFVLLFFAIRLVVRRQGHHRLDCLANTFEIAKHATISGLSPQERHLALGLLECCDGESSDDLKDLLMQMPQAPPRGSPLLVRWKNLIDRLYDYLVDRWWFMGGVIAFFAIVAITSLSSLIAVVSWSLGLGLWMGGGALVIAALLWSHRSHTRNLDTVLSGGIVVVAILMMWAILAAIKERPLTPLEWAQLAFPSLSGGIMVIGLLLMPVHRLRAYRMFRTAVLISIFFTQVLSFYEYQFLALAGLFADIAILLALRYMITDELVKVESRAPEEVIPGEKVCS